MRRARRGSRNRFRAGILGLAAFLCAGRATAAGPACTHYAAPDGSARASGATRDQPFRVASFWNRDPARGTTHTPAAGETLCLLDGRYRGDDGMIVPPRGASGRPGSPVTVRALNDGGVLIDGEGRRDPVHLRENDHWRLAGFDATGGSRSVVTIGGRKEPYRPVVDVQIRRVIASNADPRSNNHVFNIAFAEQVLLEDVAGFGTGRKIYQAYGSRRVTLRRAWARWDGHGAGNAQTVSCAYRSYDALCENVVATMSGESGLAPVRGKRGIIGMDWFSEKDERWHRPSVGEDAHDAHLRVLGSLAYLRAEVPPSHRPASAFWFDGVKSVELADLVAWVEPRDVRTFNLGGRCGPPGPDRRHFDCTLRPGQDPSAVVRRLTAIGGRGTPRLRALWGIESGDLARGRPGHIPDVWGGDPASASLCFRYEDGKRTDRPLWPWPMDERIRRATEREPMSRTVRVTATVQDLLGPIPPRCLGATCADGLDNDGDGRVDADDPQCRSPADVSEQADCSDGLDNDGDGRIDHPDDPGCGDPDGAREDPPAVGPIGVRSSGSG